MKGEAHKLVEATTKPLVDGCGRRMDHLRLSLTDRCNLACSYCSVGDVKQDTHRLDVSFAVALVDWLSREHGVRCVRLTGGEPLLHPRLVEIVRRLKDLGALHEVTLTTNAQALAQKARALHDAGLTRVNVSLDTLNPEQFTRLTGGGRVADTLRGIEAALGAELTPVRINVVVQRGVNDRELCQLAHWGLSRGCTVRFLEVMPVGPSLGTLHGRLVPATVILERLAGQFALQPIAAPPGQPATEYAATSLADSGAHGVLGVIASTTRPFCDCCRRLRITSRGEILSCLFDTPGSSLLSAWDGNALAEAAADTILQVAVLAKPRMGSRAQTRPMISIGG